MGRRVEAACSPDKVGSSRGRPRRGAGVAEQWGGVGFTEKSGVRRPPCYLPLNQFKQLYMGGKLFKEYHLMLSQWNLIFGILSRIT